MLIHYLFVVYVTMLIVAALLFGVSLLIHDQHEISELRLMARWLAFGVIAIPIIAISWVLCTIWPNTPAFGIMGVIGFWLLGEELTFG